MNVIRSHLSGVSGNVHIHSQRERPAASERRPNPRSTRHDVVSDTLRRSYGYSMKMDAYSHHCDLINNYMHFHGGGAAVAAPQPPSDMDLLRQGHQFVRDDEEDAKNNHDWVQRMCLKYYNRLFKEYALADLTRYKEGKVGLRWRVEKEVVAGKGQFICGNKKCEEVDGLHSYELNFSYVEGGAQKRALVKVRVCAACAPRLFYRKIKELKAQKKAERKRVRKEARKNRRSSSSSSSSRDGGGIGGGVEDDAGSEEEARWEKGKGDAADVHAFVARAAGQQQRPITGRKTGRPDEDEGRGGGERARKRSRWGPRVGSEPEGKSGVVKVKGEKEAGVAPDGRDSSGSSGDGLVRVEGDEWTGSANTGPQEVERGREDEFDDYFSGMFM